MSPKFVRLRVSGIAVTAKVFFFAAVLAVRQMPFMEMLWPLVIFWQIDWSAEKVNVWFWIVWSFPMWVIIPVNII